MMRKLLLFVLLAWCCSFAALAQTEAERFPVDATTQRITYADVVQVPGASQAELYTRAKLWFANTFNSGKAVIEADEKDAGIVQGTGYSPMTMHYLGANKPATEVRLWHTVKIFCKDGRYRYEITNLSTATAPSGSDPAPVKTTLEEMLRLGQAVPAKRAPVVAEYNAGVTANITALRELLQAGLASPAAGGKSDW